LGFLMRATFGFVIRPPMMGPTFSHKFFIKEN
jgi:hypothetical protein